MTEVAQPRTLHERRAWMSGYAQAILDVHRTGDTLDAQQFLREIMDFDKEPRKPNTNHSRGKALYETYRRMYNGARKDNHGNYLMEDGHLIPSKRPSGLAIDSHAVRWARLKPKFQRPWNELYDHLYEKGLPRGTQG